MTGQETSLLRSAGLPMRLWCAAGSPGLFRLVRQLDHTEADFTRMSARLADAVGTLLVRDPSLSVTERRLTLAARRRLHHGLPLPPAEHASLVAVAARVSPDGWLAGALAGARELSGRLEQLRADVAARYEAEKHRLAPAGYEALRCSPVGRRALLDGTLPAGTEVAQRLAAGEAWTDRQLRKRADYLWRMIARGSAKVTPRGWLGHVALVSVCEGPVDPARPLALTGEVSTDWTASIPPDRRAAVGPGELDDGTLVSFAALLRVREGHLEVLALDPGEGIVLTPVRIRRTPLIDELYGALRGGALTLRALEAAVAPEAGDAQRLVLRQFLVRLGEMGVLQLRTPPVQRSRSWQGALPQPRGERVDGGYLDVYRRTSGVLSAADLAVLRAAIGQALRLQELMTDDAATPPRGAPPFLTGRDQPVLDILRAQLAARREPVEAGEHRAQWPTGHSPGSGYAQLLDWLDTRIDGLPAGHAIDIGARLLDRLGAPAARPDWPMDCIVRPLPGRHWALDITTPAAVLDARFIGALERLHGPLPHVEAYRGFLRRLDEESGIPSVELLFPALSRFSANAVRRPLYAAAWTGDPDLLAYCDGNTGKPRFVPLDELTARWSAGQIVISDRSGPVRPLYHSVRNAPPPWDTVASLLLRGSPQASAWRRRLRHSLTALPGRDYVPRITVAGALVLSAAQWRLPAHLLPSPGDSELTQLRQLTRLRDRFGLPRWVFLSPGPGISSPLPCDLESLQALRVLERTAAIAAASNLTPVIEEMVPSPSELTVSDLADPACAPVATELMVRLPAGAPPHAPGQEGRRTA
ncbi:lantibiotic dehydratase [Streptomyces violascens]|uniref:lantibiotic dehydratase n=1 Tax=Streptomyces violascens TaxID=67381 RepID=UPI003654628C